MKLKNLSEGQKDAIYVLCLILGLAVIILTGSWRKIPDIARRSQVLGRDSIVNIPYVKKSQH